MIYNNKTSGIFEIITESKDTFKVTEEHPIFVDEKGWTKVKDLKNRLGYFKIERIQKIKKFVIINLLSKLYLKFKNPKHLHFIIAKYNSKSLSKTKFVRRCILTNRNRGVIRKYNLSHSIFRNLVQFGLIPGSKKAVW